MCYYKKKKKGRRLEGYSLYVLLGLGVVRFKKMKCYKELMQYDGRLVDGVNV